VVFTKINSRFKLNSYTWSFLFNFEFMFEWLKFFWIQILDLNSTYLIFLNEFTLTLFCFLFKPCFLCVASFVISWNLLCLLLLYKWLPSKVILLSSVLNDYFIGFQLFSEGKLYSSISLIFESCIAYRNDIASRRNVRTIPGTRRGYFRSPSQRYRR